MATINIMATGSNYELVHHSEKNCECKPEVTINMKRRGGGNRQGYRGDTVITHNPLPVPVPAK